MHRTKTWQVSTIAGLLSNVGGLAVSIATFLRILFVHRTKYSYDINRLRRFFYIKKKAGNDAGAFEDGND